MNKDQYRLNLASAPVILNDFRSFSEAHGISGTALDVPIPALRNTKDLAEAAFNARLVGLRTQRIHEWSLFGPSSFFHKDGVRLSPSETERLLVAAAENSMSWRAQQIQHGQKLTRGRGLSEMSLAHLHNKLRGLEIALSKTGYFGDKINEAILANALRLQPRLFDEKQTLSVRSLVAEFVVVRQAVSDTWARCQQFAVEFAPLLDIRDIDRDSDGRLTKPGLEIIDLICRGLAKDLEIESGRAHAAMNVEFASTIRTGQPKIVASPALEI